jgi:death on curing protein
VRYLTKKEVISINSKQIDVFGGNFVPPLNFLHEENLDYLLEAVQAEMFGEPLYPEIYQKAGVYIFNIICNHIFQDGNKRTGLQVAIIFLLLNSYTFTSSIDDEILISFTLSVASGEVVVRANPRFFQEKHTSHINTSSYFSNSLQMSSKAFCTCLSNTFTCPKTILSVYFPLSLV